MCEAIAHSSEERKADDLWPDLPSGNEWVSRRGGSLAVKMVRHSDHEQEQLAMWETHVLQQLAHPHVRPVPLEPTPTWRPLPTEPLRQLAGHDES